MWSKVADLAWCAGLYEGEGTIHCSFQSHILKDGSKGRPFRGLRLSIHMVNLFPLQMFQELLDIGTISGPYHRGKDKWSSYYQYRVTGFEDCQYVISSIWDWLSPVRRDQAAAQFKKFKEWELVNVRRR